MGSARVSARCATVCTALPSRIASSAISARTAIAGACASCATQLSNRNSFPLLLVFWWFCLGNPNPRKKGALLFPWLRQWQRPLRDMQAMRPWQAEGRLQEVQRVQTWQAKTEVQSLQGRAEKARPSREQRRAGGGTTCTSKSRPRPREAEAKRNCRRVLAFRANTKESDTLQNKAVNWAEKKYPAPFVM